MAEQDAARPTFESFWKEGKQKDKGSQIAFVTNTSPEVKQDSTSPKDSSDASTDPNACVDKAQVRRAQVRKAQIQHRQRKAEYIRKLEEDVAQYRDLITRAEHQSQLLSKENEAFKEKLRQAGASHVVSQATQWTAQQAHQQEDSLMQQQGQQPPLVTQPSFTSETDPEHMRMQFEAQNLQENTAAAIPQPTGELFGNIDLEALTVTLSVDETLGTPCFNVSSASSGSSSFSAASSAGSEPDIHQLSPAQEQMAVNFILALEHVCWDHFSEDHMIDQEEMLEGALGHTLMASAYCMAQAPQSIFSELDNFNTQPERPPTLQWAGQGINLATLHGLALSLTNPDVEITPVQAWFDLASRFPPTLLLNPNILVSLKREFKKIVRCVFYGAVMDREYYEIAVQRVLGSMPLVAGPVII